MGCGVMVQSGRVSAIIVCDSDSVKVKAQKRRKTPVHRSRMEHRQYDTEPPLHMSIQSLHVLYHTTMHIALVSAESDTNGASSYR